MTYPSEPDDRAGLGEPAEHMPDFRAPTPPPVPQPPPTPQQPPAPAPPAPQQRAPWILAGVLGVVALLGVVVATVLFQTGGQTGTSTESGGGGGSVGTACEPPDEQPSGKKLSAESFWKDKQWSGDNSVKAERLGAWDHKDCCDIGLASAQEVLNESECAYAIETAYETDDKSMGIAQLVLVFADTSSAMSAAELDFSSFRFKDQSGVYDDTREIYGYSEPSGQYFVFTVGAVDPKSGKKAERKATSALQTFHSDFAESLGW